MGQAILQSESIDDRLFTPLSEFFIQHDSGGKFVSQVNNDHVVHSLEKSILENGFVLDSEPYNKVLSRLRYLVLYFYVTHIMEEYSDKDNSFKKSEFKYAKLPYGTLAADSFGILNFFDLGNKRIDRIDSLWEFKSQSGAIPIIFHIAFEEDTLSTAYQKREIASLLYKQPSYICKIRPALNSEYADLYNQGHDHYRKLIIPEKKFGRVALELMNILARKQRQ